MKLFDTVLLSLSAVLLIIGVHQSILHGIQHSYFFFTMATGFFLWYTLRKKNNLVKKEEERKGKPSGKSAKRKK